jgi:hypothetical protein
MQRGNDPRGVALRTSGRRGRSTDPSPG